MMDLAEGHLAALKKLQMQPRGHSVYNLGTGSGISVKEMVSAMEKASGLKIPVKVRNDTLKRKVALRERIEKNKDVKLWDRSRH